MWQPQLDFITIHYSWIIFCSILGLVVIYPYGNIPSIDAYFFGASASTESGLNTVDLKDLKTYQQLYLYFIPVITNLGFINIFVVAIRIYWFKKKFKSVAPFYARPDPKGVVFALRRDHDVEAASARDLDLGTVSGSAAKTLRDDQGASATAEKATTSGVESAYYVPPPRERDNGEPMVEYDPHNGPIGETESQDEIKPAPPLDHGVPPSLKRRTLASHDGRGPGMYTARSIENVASSVFVLGGRVSGEHRPSNASQFPRPSNLPTLSKQVTIGRNSQFHNLTEADNEKLGGIEYRALKLLLRIVTSYFFGLHLFGVVCLVPWIHNAPAKYTDWLAECGQDRTWWALYSAQTMVDNLGFTLTPDSMVSFKDATWPLLIMTFLAFAGNTCYPVFLRVYIWVIHVLAPANSSAKETLRFLLDHPRRCYTLLFPSRPTWILFGILVALNSIDVLLIITLDLNNPAVNDLPVGPRVLSALFQAASARHTGTATFNLADVNPAVQFSLLIMMYIAILPIAISIRASNTYEEKALGMYETAQSLDESNTSSYIMMHVRNQLSFDLWYIFLGTFCVCVAESSRIVDLNEPAFSVFSAFFEVVSAYGNVGLSLGHPSVMTSLSGKFTTFSKLVICAMMIRGRHRGLPYALDRAVMLPNERGLGGEDESNARTLSRSTSQSKAGEKTRAA